MKRLTLLSLLALAVLWPAGANAAVSCRDRIYNDWYADGKIASTYPVSCYRDAIAHVGADAKVYSSLVDDIKAAMRAALERKRGVAGVPKEVGGGHLGRDVLGAQTTKTSTTRASETTPSTPSKQIDTTTVASSETAGGGGIPMPIYILGGLAVILVVAGGAGGGIRYFRRRGEA